MEKFEGVVSDETKMDDVVLPGFRFHPTDEELVGFYLKKKIQHTSFPIELIKQLDIYKYDPWDLPKLACNGEKEWYFYCPRERKYRNSARPNRVTLAGFWKATGTDRPIYSSDKNECIGLKKSLVFYRGRAAKGIKTNWMMHEFRLPSNSTSTPPPKPDLEKTLPQNDSWAICRIFKKTNTVAQRALSRSWVSHIHDTSSHDHILNQGAQYNLFSPEPISCTTETCENPNFSALDVPSYKQIFDPLTHLKSYPFPFSTEYLSSLGMTKMSIDSMPYTDIGKHSESIDLQGQQQLMNNSVPIDHLFDKQFMSTSKNLGMNYLNNDWENTELVGFPFSLSSTADTFKTEFIWDSVTCPSDLSATLLTKQNNS